MRRLLTAPLTSKGQLTLPKEVRELLGVRLKGELVGFLLDEESNQVRLTRVDEVPAGEDFTRKEYEKLLALPRKAGGKTFRTITGLVRDLKKP